MTLPKLIISFTLLLVFITLVPLTSYAKDPHDLILNELTLEQLVQQKKLIIDSTIKLSEPHIVGQPLIISIEVVTDRWFGKGTHVQRFELADTIILSSSELAINSTKNINGQTWASQIREITLYPSKAQRYQLPEIAVEVSINTEKNGVVTGILTTPAQNFIITLPEQLSNISNYVVSPDFNLNIKDSFAEQHTNNDEELNEDIKYFSVGDAITRTITLTVTDSPAMLLPELYQQNQLSIQGISIYQKPSRVFDKSNRGQLIGTRIETITYIFEQAGDYQLEEKRFYWWNTTNNALEEVIIPAVHWRVTADGAIAKSNHAFAWQSLSLKRLIILSLVIGALILVVIALWRFKASLINFYLKTAQIKQKKLACNFLTQIKQKNHAQASDCLYQYAVVAAKPINTDIKQTKLWQLLNQLAFADKSSYSSNKDITVKQAKELLTMVNKTKTKQNNNNSANLTTKIKLNN